MWYILIEIRFAYFEMDWNRLDYAKGKCCFSFAIANSNGHPCVSSADIKLWFVADPGEGRSSVQILSFSCSFRRKFCKNSRVVYSSRELMLHKKSWIMRMWLECECECHHSDELWEADALSLFKWWQGLERHASSCVCQVIRHWWYLWALFVMPVI